MRYFIKTPWWLKLLLPGRIWQMNRKKPVIYLSFDDGPHPEHTTFVLDELAKYNAKATFFCLGKNVKKYPEIYRRLLSEGHAAGNHTHDHLNSNNTSAKAYVANVAEASQYIDSKLFRPPYGRLGLFRQRLLTEGKNPYHIIMWTILSGDFDDRSSPARCLENVVLTAGNGDIVVFHDSDKAAVRMRYALPKVLESLSTRGFTFEKIDASLL